MDSLVGRMAVSRRRQPLEHQSVVASMTTETMHQAAWTDSDKVAAITVAQRPPVTQLPDPEPPYPALASSLVCLAPS